MKIVTFKVTGMFGLSEIGEKRKAILIAEDADRNRALLFHPASEDGSGCYNICTKVGNYWVSVDEESYINV